MNEVGYDFQLDLDAYTQRLEALRDAYRDRIEVRIGLELGLQASVAEETKRFAERYPFDFIIGSSHLVDGVDPYYPEYYAGRTEREAYEAYFLSILQNVRTFDCFHVYGHLDYVVRYGPHQDACYDPMDYYDIFRELLALLIEKGKGIEINTGSLYKGLDFPHPHKKILQLYRSLGGEQVTVGSDAHTPRYLGYGFDRAEALLRECGFTHYTLYAGGKPQQIPL